MFTSMFINVAKITTVLGGSCAVLADFSIPSHLGIFSVLIWELLIGKNFKLVRLVR